MSRTHTAARILTAFQAAERAMTEDRAAQIAAAIAGYISLDVAISAAANEDANETLILLLAYRAALAEQADRNVLVRRLEREASDLDPRAQQMFDEAASDYGRARHRELRGETALCANFTAMAQAAERYGKDLAELAFQKRLRAAVIKAELGFASRLLQIAGAA